MRKSSFLFTAIIVLIICVFAEGCDGQAGSSMNTAGQIISSSWEGEDELDLKNEWKPLRPPVIMTKTDSGAVIALFIGEFKPKKAFISGDDGYEVWGVPIELRIKVGDIIASPPGSVIITTLAFEEEYETRSFLASVSNLAPGTYAILAEWRSEDAGALVRNRTLTVWETVTTTVSP